MSQSRGLSVSRQVLVASTTRTTPPSFVTHECTFALAPPWASATVADIATTKPPIRTACKDLRTTQLLLACDTCSPLARCSLAAAANNGNRVAISVIHRVGSAPPSPSPGEAGPCPEPTEIVGF